MRPKRKISAFVFIIVALLIATTFVLWKNSEQTKNVEADVLAYENSKSCEEEINDNCREIIRAKVLKSRTLKTDLVTHINKYLSKKRTFINYYFVSLQFDNFEEHETMLLPEFDIGDEFDIPDVPKQTAYIGFDYFSEFLLPEGAILDIEVWHGKPTVLYLSNIYSRSPIFPFDDKNQYEEISTMEREIYIIPTTDYPLIRRIVIEEEFNQAITIISLIGFFTFVTLFIWTLNER